MIPVDDSVRAELRAKAQAFTTDLTSMDTRSPAFAAKVESISSMGAAEITASANVSSRMLARPVAALASAKGAGPAADAQTKVANTLLDLRHTVTDLDPGRADLTGARKVFRFLPGGDKLKRYFDRYQSAQSQLDAIIKALSSGQDELRRDNAAIEAEKSNMWVTMKKLSEYATLAEALDNSVAEKMAAWASEGRLEEANTLAADALFPIRQRRQDLLTQMAVAAQGYLALDLVRKNNLELIKGVERAKTTTVSALRTAVIVAQALANQRLVLDQVNALNATTSGLIQSTSELLKMQGAAINQQAATAAISIESLQIAFDNVFATMDAIDTYRSEAVVSMASTVSALEQQMVRAQPYLERTRQNEQLAQG